MLERKTWEQGLQLGEMAGTEGDVAGVEEEDGDSGEMGAADIGTAAILVSSLSDACLDGSCAAVIGFARVFGRISLSMCSLTYFAM